MESLVRNRIGRSSQFREPLTILWVLNLPQGASSHSTTRYSRDFPQQIVVITFQAFEAWARDRGICREEEETPSEFLKRFTKHHL